MMSFVISEIGHSFSPNPRKDQGSFIRNRDLRSACWMQVPVIVSIRSAPEQFGYALLEKQPDSDDGEYRHRERQRQQNHRYRPQSFSGDSRIGELKRPHRFHRDQRAKRKHRPVVKAVRGAGRNAVTAGQLRRGGFHQVEC